MILKYNNYLAAKESLEDLKKFLAETIDSWSKGEVAQRFYRSLHYRDGENPTILGRRKGYSLKVMSEQKFTDPDTGEVKVEFAPMYIWKESKTISNIKLTNNFLKHIVTQKVQYTLGNGTNLEVSTTQDQDITIQKLKRQLARHFDWTVRYAGEMASLGGYSWTYYFINEQGKTDLQVFNAAEFIPFLDPISENLQLGIRFWEKDDVKYIEIYEQNGLTLYAIEDDDLVIKIPFKPYKGRAITYSTSETVEEGIQLSSIPIVMCKNNLEMKPDLTESQVRLLDNYDLNNSDLSNNLNDANEQKYILKDVKNADDIATELKHTNIVNVQSDTKVGPDGQVVKQEGSIDTIVYEPPHVARLARLASLKEQIYAQAMAVDTDALFQGGTAIVSVMAAYERLVLKASEFEWEVLKYVEQLIDVWKEITGNRKEIIVNDFVKYSSVLGSSELEREKLELQIEEQKLRNKLLEKQVEGTEQPV